MLRDGYHNLPDRRNERWHDWICIYGGNQLMCNVPPFFFFFFEPRNYSNHSKLLQLPCIWCILLKAFHALIENSEQCHSFFESSMYVCFTYVLIYKVVCHLLTMVYRHTIINGEHRHWPGPS